MIVITDFKPQMTLGEQIRVFNKQLSVYGYRILWFKEDHQGPAWTGFKLIPLDGRDRFGDHIKAKLDFDAMKVLEIF